MGRKKKKDEEPVPEPPPKESRREPDPDDSSDESYERPRQHYDIHPEIQELAYSFNIDDGLTQRLNDIMIEDRRTTWDQDIGRLYEILKDAHTPAAMLNLKLRDMEKGNFVGKAKCGPQVQEMSRKHRLDKGASTKLEEAMAMREAMGKDVEKDLQLLDEHLSASNKPSALVSMKLDALRKGFSIGHCIYSREAPLPGNQAPGVDGVFDKRGKRTMGYTDADLDRRFAEAADNGGGGALMDEATIKKLMAAERQKDAAKVAEKEAKESKKKSKEKDRDRDKEKDRDRDKDKSRGKDRDKGKSRKPSRSRSRSRKRSRSKKKKSYSRSRRRSPSSSVSRSRTPSRSQSKKKKKKR
mmetsp:Transcript_6486/g.15804  ORF Transcript_6486/g.15804 Transcript_6486/m.15804 type:complete len:354 (-) Transcript_6486:38-1099(-)